MLYVCTDASGVRGVGFFGRHMVLAADDNRAVDAFAELAPSNHYERMIVAPRPIVERYWERVRSKHISPRLIRKSQPLLAVDSQTLRGDVDGVRVRRAHTTEWLPVAVNSAAMIREELGYDPRAGSAEFDQNVRASVERGTWWVGEHQQHLCFYCNAGPHSAYTLQLQGIWTPPELRGRGFANASLFGICEKLLQEHPTLSLYVNDFNVPALKLYERLGFKQVGEFMTLLF